MMANPQPEQPVDGMVTDGSLFMFIQLLAQAPAQYDFSDTFSLLLLRQNYDGLTPQEHQFGASVHSNPRLRQALFMPSLSATRCNPILRAFYERLLAAGKSTMTAWERWDAQVIASCFWGLEIGATL